MEYKFAITGNISISDSTYTSISLGATDLNVVVVKKRNLKIIKVYWLRAVYSRQLKFIAKL